MLSPKEGAKLGVGASFGAGFGAAKEGKEGATAGVEARLGAPREGNAAGAPNREGLAETALGGAAAGGAALKGAALTGAAGDNFLTFTIDLVRDGGARDGASSGVTRVSAAVKFSSLKEQITPSEVRVKSTGEGGMDFSPIMVGLL